MQSPPSYTAVAEARFHLGDRVRLLPWAATEAVRNLKREGHPPEVYTAVYGEGVVRHVGEGPAFAMVVVFADLAALTDVVPSSLDLASEDDPPAYVSPLKRAVDPEDVPIGVRRNPTVRSGDRVYLTPAGKLPGKMSSYWVDTARRNGGLAKGPVDSEGRLEVQFDGGHATLGPGEWTLNRPAATLHVGDRVRVRRDRVDATVERLMESGLHTRSEVDQVRETGVVLELLDAGDALVRFTPTLAPGIPLDALEPAPQAAAAAVSSSPPAAAAMDTGVRHPASMSPGVTVGDRVYLTKVGKRHLQGKMSGFKLAEAIREGGVAMSIVSRFDTLVLRFPGLPEVTLHAAEWTTQAAERASVDDVIAKPAMKKERGPLVVHWNRVSARVPDGLNKSRWLHFPTLMTSRDEVLEYFNQRWTKKDQPIKESTLDISYRKELVPDQAAYQALKPFTTHSKEYRSLDPDDLAVARPTPFRVGDRVRIREAKVAELLRVTPAAWWQPGAMDQLRRINVVDDVLEEEDFIRVRLLGVGGTLQILPQDLVHDRSVVPLPARPAAAAAAIPELKSDFRAGDRVMWRGVVCNITARVAGGYRITISGSPVPASELSPVVELSDTEDEEEKKEDPPVVVYWSRVPFRGLHGQRRWVHFPSLATTPRGVWEEYQAKWASPSRVPEEAKLVAAHRWEMVANEAAFRALRPFETFTGKDTDTDRRTGAEAAASLVRVPRYSPASPVHPSPSTPPDSPSYSPVSPVYPSPTTPPYAPVSPSYSPESPVLGPAAAAANDPAPGTRVYLTVEGRRRQENWWSGLSTYDARQGGLVEAPSRTRDGRLVVRFGGFADLHLSEGEWTLDPARAWNLPWRNVAAAAAFRSGDRVRTRPGLLYQHPGMGTVTQDEARGYASVRWEDDGRTVSVHAMYLQRAAEDAMIEGRMQHLRV